jgi:hypothetical protein
MHMLVHEPIRVNGTPEEVLPQGEDKKGLVRVNTYTHLNVFSAFANASKNREVENDFD